VIQRGDICWVDLGELAGSPPAKRRPVLVVQSHPYNASQLATVIAVLITSNTNLAAMPGNVFLPAVSTGLRRDSVANATAAITLNRAELDEPVGQLPEALMHELDQGLRQVLGL
jgi:mRNA interferase MazF